MLLHEQDGHTRGRQLHEQLSALGDGVGAKARSRARRASAPPARWKAPAPESATAAGHRTGRRREGLPWRREREIARAKPPGATGWPRGSGRPTASSTASRFSRTVRDGNTRRVCARRSPEGCQPLDRQPVHPPAVEVNPPPTGPEETGDGPQHGGLPRPVAPEEGDDLAGAHLQVGAPDQGWWRPNRRPVTDLQAGTAVARHPSSPAFRVHRVAGHDRPVRHLEHPVGQLLHQAGVVLDEQDARPAPAADAPWEALPCNRAGKVEKAVLREKVLVEKAASRRAPDST